VTRIVVVSPSPLVADGLRAALAATPGWTVETADAPTDADVLVLHARDAAYAVGLLNALAPGRTAVLIGDDLREAAARAVAEARPLALLAPAATPAQLCAAVSAVLQGLAVRDPAIALPALFAPPAADDHEPLTPRELEVFELLGKGLSNRDIAGVLGISAHTAKFHVGQILAKVGAATRAEAVSAGLRWGLIGL
jgi:DNA-binding NarL/FixJ family response regulator